MEKRKILHQPKAFKAFWLTLLSMGLLVSACESRPPQLTPVLLPEVLSPTPNSDQLKTQVAAAFTPTPIPTSTSWPVNTATPTAESHLPANFNPLTGLPAAVPSRLAERPILVKVANWPQSLRPSNGLLEADFVFETYIGHQMSQFTALYYGSDALSVGPLAPACLSDSRMTGHYQAIIAFASAPPDVEAIFKTAFPDRYFQRGYTPCPPICTEPANLGGNTMVSTAQLRTLAKESAGSSFTPQLEPLTFSNEISHWDEEAERFSVLYADFSVMDWRYNPLTGQFDLWQDYADAAGKVTIKQSLDRDSQKPLAWENVLVLYTDYIEYSDALYDLDLRPGDPHQQALLLRDGKIIFGTWQSNADGQSFTFFDSSDQPLALKPGRTWVSFVGLNSPTNLVSDGVWELNFSIK